MFYLYLVYIIYQYIFILVVFYTVSWRYKRDYFHPNMNISFYITFYIINTMKFNISQFYTTFVLTIQKRCRFEPAPPPSPLLVATPLILIAH